MLSCVTFRYFGLRNFLCEKENGDCKIFGYLPFPIGTSIDKTIPFEYNGEVFVYIVSGLLAVAQ